MIITQVILGGGHSTMNGAIMKQQQIKKQSKINKPKELDLRTPSGRPLPY